MSLPTSPGPGSRRGVTVQQPKMDIYTVLLIIAALCLLVGILLFALELGKYGWTVNPTVRLVPDLPNLLNLPPGGLA